MYTDFNKILRSALIVATILQGTFLFAQITPSVNVTPPYNIPFVDLLDQIVLTINSRESSERYYVGWTLTNERGNRSMSSKATIRENIYVASGVNSFTASDEFSKIFNIPNVNFKNLDATNVYFKRGLPPDTYNFTFIIYSGNRQDAQATTSFTVEAANISILPTIQPPFQVPFDQLARQTRVLINSAVDIDDGFLTLTIRGNNGVIISTKPNTVPDYLGINANAPLLLSGSDMDIYFDPSTLNLQGDATLEMLESGLPPGSYDLCFRLWYDQNDPATGDMPDGCISFEIPLPNVTIAAVVTPPYDAPLSEFADQTTITLNSNTDLFKNFITVSITGDNGIRIKTLGSTDEFPLLGNSPVVLNGSDLNSLFDRRNLTFQGISAQAAMNDGLPPGNYNICFESQYTSSQRLAGPTCQRIQIDGGMISIASTVQPPYDNPLSEWPDQINVLINASRNIDNAYLKLDLQGDNGVRIRTNVNLRLPFDVIAMEPLNLSGSTIADYFLPRHLTYTNISSDQAHGQGLPPGNYNLCFQMFFANDQPATHPSMGCTSFSIDPALVNVSTILSPPYSSPISDWADQTQVTMHSNRTIDDGLISFLLEGSNGLRISSAPGRFQPLSLEENEPLQLSGPDLEAVLDPANLIFTNTTSDALGTDGLPPGEYQYCFRVWYNENTPASDAAPSGCANFTINQSNLMVNAMVLAPFNIPFEQLGEQTQVSVISSQRLERTYLTMTLRDQDGAILAQSNANAANQPFDIPRNMPTEIEPDLLSFLFKRQNLTFSNIDATRIYETGLSPGHYQICFQIWNARNQPLSSESTGCTNISIVPSQLSLAVSVVPPFTHLLPLFPEITQVNLLSTASQNILLRASIEGDNGVTIKNIPDFLTKEVIELEANEPVLLTGMDLDVYFEQQNLISSGADLHSIFSEGLPEGNYKVCFEALDPTGNPLPTSKSCGNLITVKPVEPPQILMPECGMTIPSNDRQPIVFNWLPAVEADRESEYVLRIVELADPNRDPNEALLASTTPSFFEQVVIGTSYYYGPADPIMEPGKTYAFQVYLNNATSRVQRINQGRSVVCHFSIVPDVVPDPIAATGNPPNVLITKIAENPFIDFSFPVSQVSGQLVYTFELKSKNKASSLQGSGKIGVAVSTNPSAGTPTYNVDRWSTEGSHPLGNINVSLLKTYLLYGKLNGKNVAGQPIGDGQLLQGQSGFKEIAPGWNDIVATTKTDAQGNFFFNVLQFDSLSEEGIQINYQSSSGDIQASYVNMEGMAYPVYRLIVESPYYCSPDVNILIQPWEALEVGTLVSRVNSYDLEVTVIRDSLQFFDYAFANAATIPLVTTSILRQKNIPNIPVFEGDPELEIMPPDAIAADLTNTLGIAVLKNLVRHDANNPNDHYYVHVSTNEHVGSYNYQDSKVPYPIFPYSDDWDWQEKEIGMTFGMPTSIDYAQPRYWKYNSEYKPELFKTTVKMKPSLPRIIGHVYSKQGDVGLPAAEFQNKMRDEIAKVKSLARPTTNGSIHHMVGLTGLSENVLNQAPNWSKKLNIEPLAGAQVKLLSVAAKLDDHKYFTGIDKVTTKEDGSYVFDQLPVEFAFDGIKDFAVIGPSRFMWTDPKGYRKEGKDIGILKWGDQYRHDFELEPDGYVYGWVTDKNGQPIKAEVFIDSLVSVTTVRSQAYQDYLGIDGPLREIFVLKAPSGDQRTLTIVPDDLGYTKGDFLVNIDVNKDPLHPQSLGGFQVEKLKHRMKFRVVQQSGDSKTPVKNALVKVTNVMGDTPEQNTKISGQQDSRFQAVTDVSHTDFGQTQQSLLAQKFSLIETDADQIWGYTDDDGYIYLSFENNAHFFDIEVQPPLDLDLTIKKLSVESISSAEYTDHGDIVLDPAFKVSGWVTYGPDSLALSNARILIDMGGDNIETIANEKGHFTLKGIPMNQNQWTISAENMNDSLTLVADHQAVTLPMQAILHFHLEQFDEFALTSLWGLPVTITNLEETNGVYVVDGAFINLPANANFRMKDHDHRLEFYQVTVKNQVVNGKNVGVPADDKILLDHDRADLVNYQTFLAEIKPTEGALLSVKPDKNAKGTLCGKVAIMSSSFQFDDNYMSFGEGDSGSDGSASDVYTSAFQMANSKDTRFSTAGSQRMQKISNSMIFVDLFSGDNTAFHLQDLKVGTPSEITTIKAGSYPIQKYHVADDQGEEYSFKVQDFNAKASLEDSYVFNDSLYLSTRLVTGKIPEMVPEILEIDAGQMIITKNGFDKIIGSEPLQFNLEEWQLSFDKWELDQHSTGIQLIKGTLTTDLFTSAMSDFRITAHSFEKGSLDLNKIEFGGIVPVKIESPYLEFDINPGCTYDNQPHWMIKISGIDGGLGASITDLPGMKSGDKIKFESITLYSNNERDMNMGDQQQTLMFYDIIDVSPDQFTAYEDGFEIGAMMDLHIPRLKKSRGGFRYTKEQGKVVSHFLGMDVDFEGIGKVRFISSDEPGSQVLIQGNFDAVGKIKDVEGIDLLGRLHKDNDSTYVIVEPLHQMMNIAKDGSNKLIEITGDMHVVNNDWDYFIFSGDLDGMKGVEDSKKRKTFKVEGDITAEGEGMDVKNISAEFGGMKITYDIQNARLIGKLEFEQDFSSVSIRGSANFITDKAGWIFYAGGSLTTPGFGELQAGIGIGDYSDMRPEITDFLLGSAYNKNLPDSFKDGFSGFFITGRKSIPQLTIPKKEFNFLIVSGSLEGQVGLDARLWMSFDESAVEFGIGVMAFAYVEFNVSAITCTELYGYIGAELGITGKYNTGTGKFSLLGCGSITLMGAVSQCVPNPFEMACTNPCISECGSISLKMEMYVDSDGTFDASMGFGSCGGGPKLDEKVGDQFNCD